MKKQQNKPEKIVYSKETVRACFIEAIAYMQKRCILVPEDFIACIANDEKKVINISTSRFVSQKRKDGKIIAYGFSAVENNLNKYPDIFYSVLISNNVAKKTFNHIIKFTDDSYFDYAVEYLKELNEKIEKAKTG